MKNQLPLSFQAPEHASFENFISGANEQLLFSLQNEAEQLIYLWGKHGSGKSHLLQAITGDYLAKNKTALYFPLQISEDISPQLLEGLEIMDLVCLDNIDAIVGNQDWEEALFHFFNRIRSSGGRLILAAQHSAPNVGIHLPDLSSRLSWGVTYQVKALEDKDKIEALKLRAHQRGFEMSDEVANYLMKHATREMTVLISLLEKLDYATLAQQRKLTIPFIKNFLVSA